MKREKGKVKRGGHLLGGGIDKRSLDFSVRVVKYASRLPRSNAGWVLGRQLIRSGTSIGANVEEAVAAYSKEDFVYKMNVSLKEARETHYWLRLMKETLFECSNSETDQLIQGSDEIRRILGAIVSSARGTRKPGP